jgi:predicted metal-dependent enzyme (double-stranded beta helix superfamily)
MTTSTLHPTTPALVPHGLDELIAALRAQVHHDGDWSATAASVADVLRAQLPAPTFLTAAERQGMPGQAAAHRLHVEPDGSFSVLAIVWRRDQWTRPHDHVSWCVFAALAGEVTEDLYELDARSATLVAAGQRDCPAGTVRCEVPPGDIHRLGNRHGDPAITLHVYGTDVTRLGSSARRTYDLPVARPGSGKQRGV